MTGDVLREKNAELSDAEKLAEQEGITVAAAADMLRQKSAKSAEARKKQERKDDGG